MGLLLLLGGLVNPVGHILGYHIDQYFVILVWILASVDAHELVIDNDWSSFLTLTCLSINFYSAFSDHVLKVPFLTVLAIAWKHVVYGVDVFAILIDNS